MAVAASIKPTHKAVVAYHEALLAYAGQNVTHETALRSAFQNLLAETSRAAAGWMLVPEHSFKARTGKTIRPDGTLWDDFQYARGHWEAKDPGDDLDSEIRKKIAIGYPLVNTIFEDTRRAVLYQNGKPYPFADLADPLQVSSLLNQFYSHVQPEIEGFGKAVAEFQDRIPQLAQGLQAKLAEAHSRIPKFQAAFEGLMELCRTSLNPNISVAAVDEMLVQHLMTERLFHRIFSDQDFTRRNVIAAEVEKVIDALIITSFNRAEFLKSLDPFYKAIEDAARTIDDFTEKQHFLNVVYEKFFQSYSTRTADTHGIVYTPQEIVDFMCASVVEVLRTEFGLELSSPGVSILDPCTGTGNFVVNLMRRVGARDLPRFYKEQLFANEVMLLPYYIAAQNIEHEYYERTGKYEPFEGLSFVDTLELAEADDSLFAFMNAENTARVERQKKAPITIVIGNPPYNVGQLNENDNNKNRKYPLIDKRVGQTFAMESTATNKNSLSDIYIKFFRWAIDRLQQRDGIVCFVSNNGFVQGISNDGVRKNLEREFDVIYHFNCRGNGRALGAQRTLEGRNVFNDAVRVGIGITILVRHRDGEKSERCSIRYHAVGDKMKTREKLAYLRTFRNSADVPWTELITDNKSNWIVSVNDSEFTDFVTIGSRAGKSGQDGETVFGAYSRGVATSRDDIVYSYDKIKLKKRIDKFAEDYNAEVDRYIRSKEKTKIDDFVHYDKIKWSESLKQSLQRGSYVHFDSEKVRMALYRPFCKQHLFFDRTLIERVYLFPSFLPIVETETNNRLIVVSDIGYRSFRFAALMSNCLVDLHLCASSDSHQCFPFYVYDEDGTNRRENITDWALGRFREHYADPSLSKWDIFHYVYGVLHDPGYRVKFTDNLKRELPRIPLRDDFRAVADAGQKLATLHVGYESVEPWPLTSLYAEGTTLSLRVEKMKLSKDKSTLVVNPTLSLAGIPPEVFEYRLGNRSALEWVIDQYQVSTDKRSGIVTDPNRADDPEYIVKLVERVVRVSVETVAIVKALGGE